MIDDNINEVNECPISAGGPIKNDKHNLSSTNEQIRELCLKLKEFSASVSANSIYHTNDTEIDFPAVLPENNLKKLQVCATKEIYQQQSAIWELLVTEQNFLKQIQFIVQVYVLGFEILRQEFFPKVMSEEIFSNLKEVSRVSLEFWKQCMQPMIDNYEFTKHIFKPQFFKNGFIQIGKILEPYILYCTEISKCRLSISSLEKSNELFGEYMKWAMNLEESNRETLCDHLAKPFLRLTKYKILLQAIQKYSDPNEKLELQEMIDSVDTFVSRVNEKIEETSLMKTLQYLNSHIETYDVIEPLGDDLIPIINQYSKFDLTTPIQFGKERLIRQSLHHGIVKLREGSSKTIDVKLFLFTDVLLITKYKKKTLGKLKVIKPPLMLDTVLVKKQSNNSFICICLNDFNCISALYHFSNGDQKNIDKWVQILEEAVRLYSALKFNHYSFATSTNLSDSIPTLKVVQSSPKHEKSRFKTSNSECSDDIYCNEFSFKRKAPVTKKHKNKKENSILKSKSSSTDAPQRKGSNPLTKLTGVYPVDKTTKLHKSNSFAEEKEKSKIIKNTSDCSDIDEPSGKFLLNSCENHLYHNLYRDNSNKKTNFTDLQVTDNRKINKNTETHPLTLKRNQSQPSSSSDNKLDRKLSISLNTLNI